MYFRWSIDSGWILQQNIKVFWYLLNPTKHTHVCCIILRRVFCCGGRPALTFPFYAKILFIYDMRQLCLWYNNIYLFAIPNLINIYKEKSVGVTIPRKLLRLFGDLIPKTIIKMYLFFASRRYICTEADL